jgi:hypothetical protein
MARKQQHRHQFYGQAERSEGDGHHHVCVVPGCSTVLRADGDECSGNEEGHARVDLKGEEGRRAADFTGGSRLAFRHGVPHLGGLGPDA